MFINLGKNFIYLRVPKTGSTSISNHLIDSFGDMPDSIHTKVTILNIEGKAIDNQGLIKAMNPHSTISQIIQKGIVDESFIKQTNIYACLRNPVDRFLSMCYHLDVSPETVDVNRNKLVEINLTRVDPQWYMWWPQTSWCLLNNAPVNKLFLYEDIDKTIKEITGEDKPLVHYHRDDRSEMSQDDPLDQSLVQEIEKLYSEDVKLYNSLISARK
jgi:hypothetical protein